MRFTGSGLVYHPQKKKVFANLNKGTFETENEYEIGLMLAAGKIPDPEQIVDKPVKPDKPDKPDKPKKKDLIERALELELGTLAQLKKWSVERLVAAIAEAEDAKYEDPEEVEE